MKVKKEDYFKILNLVNESLEKTCKIFGITFFVEEIFLYGSQLTDKADPNDIDVFVKVSGIKVVDEKQFLKEYGPTPDEIRGNDLMEIVYQYLHDQQPFFLNTPIDINFRDYDFDLDGKNILLA